MFETLFSTNSALARHRDGPLVTERHRYLQHCSDQGGTRESLRLRARSILWVAEHMAPNDFGKVDASRLHEIVHGSDSPGTCAPTTAITHVNFARPWFKYLGWWPQTEESVPFAPALDRFVAWMRDERGLTPCTIDQWRYRTSKFLHWCSETNRNLATLQPQDIDAYFVTYGAQRWSRVSAGNIAKMLRVFLRHAASTGACSATLAGSIQGSRRYALESLPYALSWDDVRRVIATAGGDTERDIRDRAILLLLAVYGLRRGEVASLRLDQIDQVAGLLHIWRLKRRQPQVYPLVPSVAEALRRYIDDARPNVPYAEVFIRTQAPRSPILATAIYTIVSRRLDALGIQAAHLGPHALRHSCAAKLLADGLTLKEIGDHLGHRSTSATMTYTKIDLASLRQVGGCSGVTRNQRLATIHSLARFVGMRSPEHLDWCSQIRSVSFKKVAKTVIGYLDKPEVDALLLAPNRCTSLGSRDHALLLFLYNSGARADEAASLRVSNLQLGTSPSVRILGKGNKWRVCPLWPVTVATLRPLVAEKGADEHVFLGRTREPITRFGVHRIVNVYAKEAAKSVDSMQGKRISPHSIRHTTAVHLLRAGVDINTIRAWLGHVSLNTTHVYAEVDLDMKAKALASVDITDLPAAACTRSSGKSAKIMNFMKQL